ncbi:hypothetical protein [Pararhodonellum marinum]|uniref:hypothetical protein n=1 Tax=Pararhodonellum marinum TaxID=2755358 RepID=UPI00188DD45E|nr:hypothetical protein [Pararhodonellum marinum]
MPFKSMFLGALFLCSMMLTPALFAQNQSDFIQLNDGEKRTGKVILNEDDKTHTSLLFLGDSGKKERYGPADLHSFYAADFGFFISEYLIQGREKVFVQVLVKGEKDLLYYKGRFYLSSEGKFLPLIKENLQSDGKQNTYVTKEQYKGFLSYAFFQESCQLEMNRRIGETGLRKNQLIDLFAFYHECAGKDFQVYHVKQSSIRFQKTLAIGSSQLTTDSGIESINPSISLQSTVRMHFPRITNRFFLEAGLNFQEFDLEYRSETVNVNTYYLTEEDFELRMIGIPITLNYTFYSNRNLKLYGGLGASYYFLSKNTNWMQGTRTQKYVFVNRDDDITYFDPLPLEFPKTRLMRSLKAGVEFPVKKIGALMFEVQLDATNRLLAEQGLNGNSRVFSYLTSYRLGFRF